MAITSPARTPQAPSQSNTTPVVAKFYKSWVHKTCVQDCDGAWPCGGQAQSWDYVYDTLNKCCDETDWYNDNCKLSWMDELGKLFVHFWWLRRTTCCINRWFCIHAFVGRHYWQSKAMGVFYEWNYVTLSRDTYTSVISTLSRQDDVTGSTILVKAILFWHLFISNWQLKESYHNVDY